MSGGPMHRYLVACGVLAVSATASAQAPGGNITLDPFRPAMDSRGYITVNASQVLGDKELSFGLGALDWGHGLLTFGNSGDCGKVGAAPCYTVSNMLTATLIGAFGIHAGPAELEFGVSVPFVIMYGDRGPDINAGPNNDMAF